MPVYKKEKAFMEFFIENDQEYNRHSCGFCNNGSYGSAIETNRRHTPASFDQQKVKQYIQPGGYNKAVFHIPAVVGTYQHGISHMETIKKGKSPYTYTGEFYCFISYFGNR